MKYHIWTEGCQMNVADSLRVSSALEHLGYLAVRQPEEADVIVLNTCVVRQSAEDKAYGRLYSLRPLKTRRPDLVINLMGCLVGVKGHERLKARFPFVDVFSPPSDPGPPLAREVGRCRHCHPAPATVSLSGAACWPSASWSSSVQPCPAKEGA